MKKLVIAPAKILRTGTQEVTEHDWIAIPGLVQHMKDVLASSREEGQGLSAPQVGVKKRVIIYRDGGTVRALINPVILEKKDKITSYQEGCLSFPGLRVDVKRYRYIHVEGLDEGGSLVSIENPSEAVSIILQHEIDHLFGTTIRKIAKANKKRKGK